MKNMEESRLSSEMICKIWKKSKSNSDKIWTTCKKDKLKCEMIWKIWKKTFFNKTINTACNLFKFILSPTVRGNNSVSEGITL
jgi:hypothetical protein